MSTPQPQQLDQADLYCTTGKRLSHILDSIEFPAARGRAGAFHQYLMAKRPEEFGELKLTTVRSWFHDHSPPMRKAEIIFIALNEDYPFPQDFTPILGWWKIGGVYPFDDLAAVDERLQFIVMAMVSEAAGEQLSQLGTDDLINVKDRAMTLAMQFRDPTVTECPADYMRALVNFDMQKIKAAMVQED